MSYDVIYNGIRIEEMTGAWDDSGCIETRFFISAENEAQEYSYDCSFVSMNEAMYFVTYKKRCRNSANNLD